VQVHYTWAVYKWLPDDMRWRFDRLWAGDRDNPKVTRFVYEDMTASLKGPPGYSSVFSGLKADEAVFFVSYPNVPATREMLYHSLDWRFNSDIEEP